VTLDSQGVACGTGDVTDFEPLNVALGGPAKREVFRYAFDLVELDGRDMRREPVGPARASCAVTITACGYPTTSKETTARPCSVALAL
jgi:hypothetical protein